MKRIGIFMAVFSIVLFVVFLLVGFLCSTICYMSEENLAIRAWIGLSLIIGVPAGIVLSCIYMTEVK